MKYTKPTFNQKTVDPRCLLAAKIRRSDKFRINKKEVFKLEKPLYGLYNSGDYWNVSIDYHLTKDFHMNRAISDSSLYFKTVNNKLSGITGNYLAGSLNDVNETFQDETKLNLRIVESKPRTYDHFTFFGTQSSQNDMDGTFSPRNVIPTSRKKYNLTLLFPRFEEH